jgi:hypothetical protein
MAMVNLNDAYAALESASTPEGKKAISDYIRITSEHIVSYGKDTNYWPQDAIFEMGKAGREAYDIEGTASWKKSKRDRGC